MQRGTIPPKRDHHITRITLHTYQLSHIFFAYIPSRSVISLIFASLTDFSNNIAYITIIIHRIHLSYLTCFRVHHSFLTNYCIQSSHLFSRPLQPSHKRDHYIPHIRSQTSQLSHIFFGYITVFSQIIVYSHLTYFRFSYSHLT